MMKQIYTCDHCGKELNAMIDFIDIDVDDLNEWFNIDLCRSCYEELTRFVIEFCGKKMKEEV